MLVKFMLVSGGVALVVGRRVHAVTLMAARSLAAASVAWGDALVMRP